MKRKFRGKNLTKKDVFNKALKYKTRKGFYIGDGGAYKNAMRNGFLDEVCSHMKQVYKTWNNESLKKEALKYKSKADFMRGSGGAHKAAINRGILNDICSHMISIYTDWTLEMLEKEALKYTLRKDFEFHNKAAYGYASNHGMLDKICSHMKRGVTGFNPEKPGTLYYVKIDTRISTTYKIGITNHSVKRRFKNNDSKKITVIKTWFYENGRDALNIETFILNHYKQFQYTGEPIIGTGNTEMFTKDVMGLYRGF